MRVSVGLFLVVGLISAGCTKSDPAGQDSQAIGADNGVVLGEGQPQTATTPAPGVVTPTKVVTQPAPLTRPAFGAIGGATPTVPNAPAQPAATQAAPPAAPIAKATVATPTPASPPVAGAVATGRGVPPPPGGRPKPGTK
jgi:hypothetical protein